MSMFSKFKRSVRPRTTTAFVSDNQFAVTRTAPPPPSKPDPVTKSEGETDKGKQSERENKDTEVEADQGRANDDSRQPETGKPKDERAVVVSNQRKYYSEGSNSGNNAGKSYFGFWNLEVDYHLEDIHHEIVNQYTPNAVAMFVILEACDVFVSGNNWIQRYAPEYLHYGVLCYYSILFYYQILRARRAAGKLVQGTEGKFLRRFEKKFKPERLVVAGPLVPFFSSIISHDMGDGKYDWVVPQIASEIMSTGLTMANFATGNGSCYLQPMVPYMLATLRTMVTNSFFGVASVNEDDYFPGTGDLVLGPLNDLTFCGMRIRRGNAATDQDDVNLLSTLGLSSSTLCSVDQLTASRRNWNRSSFAELNIGAIAVPGGVNSGTDANITVTDGTTNIAGIANFLLMPESSNMNFFDKLIENATTHADIFKYSSKMSDIPNVGGRDSLILGTFKRHGTRRAPGADYNDLNLGRTHANVAWYPRLFDNMTCTFVTDRADIHRVDELQAFSFAINAELPIVQAAGPPVVRVGNTTGAADSQRTGPYFEEREQPVSDYRDGDAVGKAMFNGWRSMIKEVFALSKPEST